LLSTIYTRNWVRKRNNRRKRP